MNAAPKTNIASAENQSVVLKPEANVSKLTCQMFSEESHKSETKQQNNKKINRKEDSEQLPNTKNFQRPLSILIELCKKDEKDERGGKQL